MSSSTDFESVFSLPFAALEYRDMAGHLVSDVAVMPGNPPQQRGKQAPD